MLGEPLVSSLLPPSRLGLIPLLTGLDSPARFYVSVIMKMILSHLVVNYEVKLEEPTARPYLTFGKTRLPSPFMTILVRRRVVDTGRRSGR